MHDVRTVGHLTLTKVVSRGKWPMSYCTTCFLKTGYQIILFRDEKSIVISKWPRYPWFASQDCLRVPFQTCQLNVISCLHEDEHRPYISRIWTFEYFSIEVAQKESYYLCLGRTQYERNYCIGNIPIFVEAWTKTLFRTIFLLEFRMLLLLGINFTMSANMSL